MLAVRITMSSRLLGYGGPCGNALAHPDRSRKAAVASCALLRSQAVRVGRSALSLPSGTSAADAHFGSPPPGRRSRTMQGSRRRKICVQD